MTTEYDSRNKRREKEKARIRRASFWVIAVTCLFTISFFVGSRFHGKKNIAVNATNVSNEKVAKTSNESGKQANSPKDITDSNENSIPTTPARDANSAEAFNPYKPDGHKVVYLTFDDGPSKNTNAILDILKQDGIKATFFLIGKNASEHPDLVTREYNEGHVLGNHTYSHNYKYVYADPNNFLDDLSKCNTVLKGIIPGYDSKLIRFPGGSFGNHRGPFKDAVVKAGYHYIDWNVLNGDAEAQNVPPDKLFLRLKQTLGNQQHAVILMHDAPAKGTTVQALPEIIKYLKERGYEFSTLR